MALVSAGIAAPVMAYLADPFLRRGSRGDWIQIGRVDDLPLQVPQRLEVTHREIVGWVTEEGQVTAWVVRFPDKLYVFDPHCTHLGCAYHWHEESKQFFCPCHAGVFDIQGRVISGPPPRPLDLYEYEVRQGSVYVVPNPVKRMV